MADLKKAGLCLFVFNCAAAFVIPVPQNLTVNRGDDAVLSCEVVTRSAPSLLVWSRSDLRLKEFVYFNRGDNSGEKYQLSSYRGRVQLLVPHMKNGNTSVVLKNVTMNDTGTYECKIETSPPGRTRRGALELISIVNLKVEDSGDSGHTDEGREKNGGSKNGITHPHIGLIVTVVILVLV